VIVEVLTTDYYISRTIVTIIVAPAFRPTQPHKRISSMAKSPQNKDVLKLL